MGGGGPAQDTAQVLPLDLANRHGLITGATGTGKTVTMQILAEGFSAAGVPVFMADVKGDVSGLSMAGAHKDFLFERASKIGFDGFALAAFPVVVWDLFGQQGHPVRTTVTDIGPLLLARMLDLTEVQEGVLTIAFAVSDDQNLALPDLDDLRAMLMWLDENTPDVKARYGNVSSASIGAIQRALLVLENEGAPGFLGEPALDLADRMTTQGGKGRINVLMADRLMTSPRLYSMVLLWLLSELFEVMPEIGNPEKPVLVVIFDEAHLLLYTAPKALHLRPECIRNVQDPSPKGLDLERWIKNGDLVSGDEH